MDLSQALIDKLKLTANCESTGNTQIGSSMTVFSWPAITAPIWHLNAPVTAAQILYYLHPKANKPHK